MWERVETSEALRAPVRRPAPPDSQILALQRGAGNHAVSRLLQRKITGQLNGDELISINSEYKGAKEDAPWYASKLSDLLKLSRTLIASIKLYNDHEKADERDQAKGQLPKVVENMRSVVTAVEDDLMWNVVGDFKGDGAKLYGALVRFKSQLTAVSTAINNEVARVSGITRAGPGGRPDANNPEGIDATVASGALSLTDEEAEFLTNFVNDQQGNWKQRKEALTAIWALRAGKFTDLHQGKGNKYGSDVEYETADPDKPELWDQKTIFFDQTGFDGRLHHTHTKNTDDRDKGVGLLFDATFEGRGNYEKAWLEISHLVLSGAIAPEAVMEVRAPHPEQLRAGIYVDMTTQGGEQDGEEQKNVRWAEKQAAGDQIDGLEVIDESKLGGTGLDKIKGDTETPYARYANNRDWLPAAAYSEFPAKGLPNPGKGRYVVSDADGQGKRTIYLSVTHYKGFTLHQQGGDVHRNAFYRVRLAQ